MRQFLKKKKSWFYSPWVALFLVVFVVWGLVSVCRAYLKQHEAVALRDESRMELEELEQKQNSLSEKINDLSTDAGMEAEVRERYRVVKPGEQLVIVVDNEDNAQESVQKPSFWSRLRMFVGF